MPRVLHVLLEAMVTSCILSKKKFEKFRLFSIRPLLAAGSFDFAIAVSDFKRRINGKVLFLVLLRLSSSFRSPLGLSPSFSRGLCGPLG